MRPNILLSPDLNAVVHAPLERADSNPSANTLTLLHSGKDYFPALLLAIAAAKRSIALHTYIFADDVTGHAVRDALIAASLRGVMVSVVVDGFGSGRYGHSLAEQLRSQGVRASVYRPWYGSWLGARFKLLHRLHRKCCVIDEHDPAGLAFVGGINILDDFNHAPHQRMGLGPRFDFAVRVQGRWVHHIAQTLSTRTAAAGFASTAKAAQLFKQGMTLVLRDNVRHRNAIQTWYLKHLASAQHEVWIANAYFVPGRKMRQAILRARARGVAVNLLLQGRQEYFLQHHATQALYGQLLQAGVAIYEYQASFLHAKVAVFDEQYATVGSSNIDPFSLLLAHEANLWINGADFARQLKNALIAASQDDSTLCTQQQKKPIWQRVLDWLAYGLLRLGVLAAVRRRY